MVDQFETSEMIAVVEVSYRVVKVEQQKYVCRCGGCVDTAPRPERATAGSRYSLSLAIKVAVDKYCDHIPLADKNGSSGATGSTSRACCSSGPSERARGDDARLRDGGGSKCAGRGLRCG
jgi:hypothetical protein